MNPARAQFRLWHARVKDDVADSQPSFRDSEMDIRTMFRVELRTRAQTVRVRRASSARGSRSYIPTALDLGRWRLTLPITGSCDGKSRTCSQSIRPPAEPSDDGCVTIADRYSWLRRQAKNASPAVWIGLSVPDDFPSHRLRSRTRWTDSTILPQTR